MRRILLLIAAVLIGSWQTAGAVTIATNQDLGAVPAAAGTGLTGYYYKFNTTSNIGTLAQATSMMQSSGGPTATFTSNEICFPDCAGTSISDSSTMTQFVNGHDSNFSYTVPPSQIPTAINQSAMMLTGYIAITQAGTYTFNLGSDDGSELTIGGQVVINNDNDHSFQVDTGSATFTQAGLYAISIEYFEDSGSTGLDFYASDNSGACIIGRAANCASGSATTGLLYSALPTATPEPASLGVFATGLGVLLFLRCRRARAA